MNALLANEATGARSPRKFKVMLQDKNWYDCEKLRSTCAVDYDGDRYNVRLAQKTTITGVTGATLTFPAGHVFGEAHTDCVKEICPRCEQLKPVEEMAETHGIACLLCDHPKFQLFK